MGLGARPSLPLARPARPGPQPPVTALTPPSERREKEPLGGVGHEDKTGSGHGRRGGARAGAWPHLRCAMRAADTGVPYGWLLQLRGHQGAGSHDERPRSRRGRRTSWRQAYHRRRQQDARGPADDLTYTGVALWRLVGRIDDGPRRLQREARHQRAGVQRRRHRRRRVQRHLHERRGRDAEEQAGRREQHEQRAAQCWARPRSRTTRPAGSPTGRSSWSPATPGIFGTASRPASPASASCRRRRAARGRHRRALRLAAAAARHQGARPMPSYTFQAWKADKLVKRDHRRRQQDARRPERRPHLHRRRALAARRPHRRRRPRRPSTGSSPPPRPATTSWSRASTASAPPTRAPRSRR